MRLGHLELFVKDPLASRHFYEDILSCEVIAVQDDRFVWLKLGALEILLRPGQPPKSNSYRLAALALVLYTDDLATAAQRLQAHGVALGAMEDAGQCYTFQDADGHWFQLVNPQAMG